MSIASLSILIWAIHVLFLYLYFRSTRLLPDRLRMCNKHGDQVSNTCESVMIETAHHLIIYCL